jgi:hypothetical protein
MMKPRDFLQRRLITLGYPEQHTMVMCYQSEEHEDCPEKKGFIRAQTSLSGFIVRDLGGGACQATIISQTDIKGTIPKLLINYVTATFAPRQVKKFMEFAKSRKEEDVQINPEMFRVIITDDLVNEKKTIREENEEEE